jgi:GNAT superfamily N-acetyltransferase
VRITARDLDLLGARAWPPLEETKLGEWRMRFAGGVTKRANSVLPLGPESASPAKDALERRLALVERAYEQRALPPRFQVTASSWPSSLPEILRDRGYTESDCTLVLTTAIQAADTSTSLAEDRAILVRGQVSASWFDAWWGVDGRGGQAEAKIARAILDRIELPCLFVEYHEPAGTSAVALGVMDHSWVGIYCLATVASARRRGCARAIVTHLLMAARHRGAIHAHLSVLASNTPSRQLCGAFGFEERQRYSYFTADAA